MTISWIAFERLDKAVIPPSLRTLIWKTFFPSPIFFILSLSLKSRANISEWKLVGNLINYQLTLSQISFWQSSIQTNILKLELSKMAVGHHHHHTRRHRHLPRRPFQTDLVSCRCNPLIERFNFSFFTKIQKNLNWSEKCEQ